MDSVCYPGIDRDILFRQSHRESDLQQNLRCYDMMVNGTDYNLVATMIFNPNYSIIDWINCFRIDMGVYMDFFASEEFASFSLKDRVDYQVPFYNINKCF